MTRKEWTNHLERISDNIGGTFKITHSPSIGSDLEYFIAQISVKLKDRDMIFEQLFIQYDYENFVAEKICITYEFENSFDFHLSIYEREFLEKLFNRNRIETGHSTFDSKFTIKSNDKDLAKKIFCNIDLQNQFLSNRLLIFNISSKKHLTTISMKDLEKKLYDKTEYLSMLRSIQFVTNTIMN